MPGHQQPKKDVQDCENPRGAAKTPIETRESEWGNPLELKLENLYMNKIVYRGEACELKHLSNMTKRK